MVWKNYIPWTKWVGQNGSIIFFQVLLVMFLTDEAEKWKVGVVDIWQRKKKSCMCILNTLTRLWLQDKKVLIVDPLILSKIGIYF